MSKTILVTEDETRMRKLIAAYLSKEGYCVLEAENGIQCLELFDKNKIDLVILDIMMPGPDGFSVCRTIREYSTVPLMLLTAKSSEEDKLTGFELGADDYITKPFSPKVLVARTKALFKRIELYDPADDNIFSFNDLEIHPISHEVYISGMKLDLSPKEYDLLLFLARNKNIALTREKLLDKLWGYDYDGDWRTVDTHIKRLREKLGEKSGLIVTVRGTGYKLEAI